MAAGIAVVRGLCPSRASFARTNGFFLGSCAFARGRRASRKRKQNRQVGKPETCLLDPPVASAPAFRRCGVRSSPGHGTEHRRPEGTLHVKSKHKNNKSLALCFARVRKLRNQGPKPAHAISREMNVQSVASANADIQTLYDWCTWLTSVHPFRNQA